MKGRLYFLLLVFTLFASTINAQEKVAQDQNTSKTKTTEAGKSNSLVSGMTAMCQKACGAKDYDPAAVVSILDAKIGDLTTCPVSGVVFRVVEASSNVKFKEDAIYTCCATCASLYNLDPDKYAPTNL